MVSASIESHPSRTSSRRQSPHKLKSSCVCACYLRLVAPTLFPPRCLPPQHPSSPNERSANPKSSPPAPRRGRPQGLPRGAGHRRPLPVPPSGPRPLPRRCGVRGGPGRAGRSPPPPLSLRSRGGQPRLVSTSGLGERPPPPGPGRCSSALPASRPAPLPCPLPGACPAPAVAEEPAPRPLSLPAAQRGRVKASPRAGAPGVRARLGHLAPSLLCLAVGSVFFPSSTLPWGRGLRGKARGIRWSGFSPYSSGRTSSAGH